MITKIGQFCVHKEDTESEDVGIIVYDCVLDGYENLLMVKWLVDGKLSTCDNEDLTFLTPFQGCKIWCKGQVLFPEEEERTK